MLRIVALGFAGFVVACDAKGPEAPTTPAALPAPSTSALPAPSASTPPAPPSDATRDARIRQRFGDHCRLERTCGSLWGVDCEAAVDGPYYYVKPDTLEVVSRCGGYCMGGRCTNCPPHEWTCHTY